MFSPPKVHPFEENYIQKVLMDLEQSPMLQYDMPSDLQLFKSQSLLFEDDQLSPFQFSRNLPLQRFNSEVFRDFSDCAQQIIGDNNKFLKTKKINIEQGHKFSGDFEVIHLIGKGSKGKVYKVLSKIDGLYYAAKKVPLNEDIQSLTLNGQVQFNCCYQYEGFLYIIMEHCEYSLKQRLKSRMFESEIRQIIVDVCEALQGLPQPHQHIHGGNVLFSKQMKYKLSDFGFSNNITHQPQESKTKASDIYQLGVLLMELMLEKEIVQLTTQILQKFDNLSYYSVSLKSQIKKMVSLQPEQRPDAIHLIQFANVNIDQELTLLQEQNAELQKQVDEMKPKSHRRLQSG